MDQETYGHLRPIILRVIREARLDESNRDTIATQVATKVPRDLRPLFQIEADAREAIVRMEETGELTEFKVMAITR